MNNDFFLPDQVITEQPHFLKTLIKLLLNVRNVVMSEKAFIVQWKNGRYGRVLKRDIVEGERIRSAYYERKVGNKAKLSQLG